MSTTQTEEKDRQMIEGEPDETHESDAGDAFAEDGSAADEGEKQEEQQPKGEGGELFDPSRYDNPELRLPTADGEGIDKIALKFAGTVYLDRSDKADVALMRKLKLGHDVSLMVEGRCSQKIEGFTTDREGELDVIVLSRGVKVHSVYVPAGGAVKDDA